MYFFVLLCFLDTKCYDDKFSDKYDIMYIKIVPIFFLILLLSYLYVYLWSKKRTSNEFHLKYILRYIAVLLTILIILYLVKFEYINEKILELVLLLRSFLTYYFFIYAISVLSGKKADVKWFHIAPLTLPFIIMILDYFNIHFTGVKTLAYYDVQFKETFFISDKLIVLAINEVFYLVLFIQFYIKNYENLLRRAHVSKFTAWVFIFIGLKTITYVLSMIEVSFVLDGLTKEFFKYFTLLSMTIFFLNPSFLRFFINYGIIKEFILSSENQSALDKINHQISKNKIFLDKELSLVNFSALLEITPDTLSQVIKSEKGLGFSDYINHERIAYANHLIKHGYLNNHSISGLPNTCGFKSERTFFRAFKKINEVSPSVYWKVINDQKD